VAKILPSFSYIWHSVCAVTWQNLQFYFLFFVCGAQWQLDGQSLMCQKPVGCCRVAALQQVTIFIVRRLVVQVYNGEQVVE
jgi:hypothetical protein